MIIKLIIYFALGYLVFRFVKSVLLPKPPPSQKARPQSTGQIDDVMIKDPFCETYFPERDGVHLEFDGKQLVFCSTGCRDKFLDAHTNAKSHDD